MTVETTAAEIRALLRVAELDAPNAAGADEPRARQMRAAAAKTVPTALLEAYEALLARGRTPAVSPVQGGSCSGCHLRLPAVLEHQIRKAPGVFTCPHCRRLLYDAGQIKGGADDPAAAAVGTRARAR